MFVTMNITVFWEMMLYNLVASCQQFGENLRLEKCSAVMIYTWVTFPEHGHKQRFEKTKANYPV